jgi:phosphatidate phosphatase APP1
MKTKLLLILTLLLSTQILFAKELVIISDLDETIRIANVENKFKAGLNIFVGVKPYEGLRAIFNELKRKNPDAKFYYLSNSFPFIYSGKKWTKKNGFPEGITFQRSLRDKSANFKPRKLKEIANAHPDASFIMFGDNVEHDPKFYRNFLEETRIKDAQVFIRDARLIFTQDPEMTYFQTEAQITQELMISEKTTSMIKNLSLNKLVPNYLFENLRKRFLKECDEDKRTCVNLASKRVLEVAELIKADTI